MSATPFPGPYPTTIGHILVHHITAPAASKHARTTSQTLRRRPTMNQGRALETLGHAIEYLIDSRTHDGGLVTSLADIEAEKIMMRLSREVFAECHEAVRRGGLKLWLRQRLAALQGV